MPNTAQFRNAEAIDRILPNIDNDMKRRNITLNSPNYFHQCIELNSFIVLKADRQNEACLFYKANNAIGIAFL